MPRKKANSFKKMVLMPVNKFHEAHISRQGYKKFATPPPRPPITPALLQHREKMKRKRAPPPPRPPITAALRQHREMLHRRQKRKAPPRPIVNNWSRL